MTCPDRLAQWSQEVSTACAHLSKPQLRGLVLWSVGMALAGVAGIMQSSALLALLLHEPEHTVLQRLHEWYLDAEQKSGKRRRELEAQLADTREKIINLLAVAEGARDETTRQLYRERLVTLEKDLRDTEALLTRLANSSEHSQKLLTALDKFEAWAVSQQSFLSDPDYQVTKEDKRAALIILGVNATVWPAEGYPEHVQFQLCPPDIQRFCDFFFQ